MGLDLPSDHSMLIAMLTPPEASGGAQAAGHVAVQRDRHGLATEDDYRLFAVMALLMVGLWGALAVLDLALQRPLGAIAGAVAAVLTLCVRAWGLARQAGVVRLGPAVHMVAGVSALALVAEGLLAGGWDPLAVWYLAAIPLFVGHLAGARPAVGWAVAALVLVAVAAWIPPLPFAEPIVASPEVERMLGLLGLLAAVVGFTVAARRTRDRQVAAIVARERHIRQQARALEIARDEALDAARAKSEFLANMSHEVRTPLNGVIGMTALLGRTPLEDDQRRMVRTLERSGRALLSIVNEILDLSKIESGGIRIAHAPWSVRHVIDEVVSLVSPTAVEKGLQLVTDIGAEVPTNLMGDGARVRQVLLNLVGNAIKFTPHGTITIRAFTDARSGLGVAVEDTGIGIPEDKLPLLFDAFTQLSEGEPRRHGGTGLGLTISRRLARMMGGNLEVTSRVGRGSTFTVTLPLERSARERRVSETSPRVDETLASRHPLAILVAEDTEVNREVVVGMLRAFGYEADVATDGPQVLAAVRQRTYDLVLMDLRMPGLDGLEATRRIRAELPPAKQPRIFALTANVLAEHRVLTREAGMDGFIGKPVSFEDIGSALVAAGVGVRPGDPPAPDSGLPAAPASPPALGSPASELGSAPPAPSADDALPAPLAKLLFVLGGEPTRLHGLISKHLGHSEELVGAIEVALARGDLESVERHAHSLKSSSAMFGSTRVSEIAADLERAAVGRVAEVIRPLFADLRRECAEAERDLRRFAG